MASTSCAILQATVPHYRERLYDLLANKFEPGKFRVHAGESANGHPSSVARAEHVRYDVHEKSWFGGRFRWQFGAMKVVNSLQAGDTLVICGSPRLLNNVIVMAAAARRGVRTVWWGQGFTAGSAGRVQLRQEMMKKADSVILYTNREVDRYHEMGFDHPSLLAFDNALDQEPIEAARGSWTPSMLHEFQLRQGIDPATNLVVVGRVTAKMELPVLLAALKDPLLSKFSLTIIGGQEQGSTLIDSQLSGRVRWVGALYEEEQIAPWMLSSAVFVYPGAIGLSIFHGFGYGLPVVTHSDEANQMPEFAAMKPGINGITFDRGDSASLAHAIIKAHANREFLSVGASLTVAKEWRIEDSAEKFFQACQANSSTEN